MAQYILPFLFLWTFSASGELRKASPMSNLHNDPSVVYVESFTPEKIEFTVKTASPIYATKAGRRVLGYLKVGSRCELTAFDHRAFKIRGEAQHAGASGWVSPLALESADPDFATKFQELYSREMVVRELIANEEIAIGMTPYEVERVMGEPTRTKLRRTSEGTSGLYEYLVIEEKKHYTTVRNRQTGQVFRQFSHTTEEIKSRVGIEFEENAVTAIEKDENNEVRGGGPRIVSPPIIINWAGF